MLAKLALISTLAVGLPGAAAASQIRGDYVETRNADVYTGPCFANGEVNLAGDQALLGWKVSSGSWAGIPLDGLIVAGAVRARGTLGDPYENPYPARSVILVDSRATAAQRDALVALAKTMGGELLGNVVRVEPARMAMDVERHGEHATRAVLRADGLAAVETRPIGDKDHVCGNETTFYPPLTETAGAMPAVASRDEYAGPGLGVAWSCRGKRSAFVGTFER